jgi:hypothetical protein
MNALSAAGDELIERVTEIEFTSVADLAKEDELNDAIDTMGEKFRELDDMKSTLIGGLTRKVKEKLDAATPSSRVKSMTNRRKSVRKTVRAKSI